MKAKSLSLVLLSLIVLTTTAHAKSAKQNQVKKAEVLNALDRFNPRSADAEAYLESVDEVYMQEAGIDVDLLGDVANMYQLATGACTGVTPQSCAVYALISRASQTLTLYINGVAQAPWKVSTGRKPFTTPRMSGHPNGRIYTKYTSTKFPGGDYKGLGNMPYAVFIRGGYAIHGTGAIGNLGRVASHGCIRVHPDNAKRFNAEVRKAGVLNTWITVN